MSCTVATLAACFTLSGIHFDAGASWMSQDRLPPTNCGEERCYWEYDITYRHNPYGVLAIGYAIELPKITWDFQARHQSSISNAHDLGENTLQLSMSWHPFR